MENKTFSNIDIPGVIPVFPITETFRLEIPFSDHKKNFRSIKRTMLPFIVGYAITCYKSQSSTYKNCVIDFQGAKGGASCYVQASRAKSFIFYFRFRWFKNSPRIYFRETKSSNFKPITKSFGWYRKKKSTNY